MFFLNAQTGIVSACSEAESSFTEYTEKRHKSQMEMFEEDDKEAEHAGPV